MSLEENVKGALNKVALGEADAALVYRADVQSAGTKVHGIDFPESAKAINDYPIATRTKAPQPALAKEFVQLVVSPQRKGALAAAGFEAPDLSPPVATALGETRQRASPAVDGHEHIGGHDPRFRRRRTRAGPDGDAKARTL